MAVDLSSASRRKPDPKLKLILKIILYALLLLLLNDSRPNFAAYLFLISLVGK
jgi:hypothetical protein